ncbi:MAG: hypothetical protein JWP89_5124 [Schlesneria sp.]|nr:hypothetical protein [Schlesneria sp.]
MNSQVPDELISAYFDGEASPEERAVVERLLVSSDEAQRELSETAKLSALLHSFPRESAPAELIGNVLRQTEQMATPVQATTVATAAPVPVRNVWRDWKAGFVGAVVSAAAMGLVIALTNPSVDHAAKHVFMGPAESDSTSVSGLEAKQDMPLAAMDDQSGDLDRHAKTPSAGTELAETEAIHPAGKQGPSQAVRMVAPRAMGAAMLKSQSPAMPAKIAADAVAPPSPVADTAPAEVQSLVLNELGQTNDEFLQSVSKGEVIALMPKAADPNSNVAVVYLEVVDITRSADQIQVLLKKNSIAPRSFKKDGEASPDDLVVIYLEAPGEKLANTLKDVDRHRDLFVKWSPQAPLQLAANSDEATQTLRKKESAVRGSTADKEKQSDAKDAGTKPDAEMPNVEIVLEALAQRDGYQNASGANQGVSDLTSQNGNSRDGIEKLQRQQIANSTRGMTRNESYSRNGNAMGNGGQLKELTRIEPGYDFVRMNNSTTFGNSVTSNGLNLPQSNTTALNPFRADPQRRTVANYDDAKPASGETGNRALRMLFVLHPQSEGTPPPAAAAPVPAKPE